MNRTLQRRIEVKRSSRKHVGRLTRLVKSCGASTPCSQWILSPPWPTDSLLSIITERLMSSNPICMSFSFALTSRENVSRSACKQSSSLVEVSIFAMCSWDHCVKEEREIDIVFCGGKSASRHRTLLKNQLDQHTKERSAPCDWTRVWVTRNQISHILAIEVRRPSNMIKLPPVVTKGSSWSLLDMDSRHTRRKKVKSYPKEMKIEEGSLAQGHVRVKRWRNVVVAARAKLSEKKGSSDMYRNDHWRKDIEHSRRRKSSTGNVW